jgi:hypothetical protein
MSILQSPDDEALMQKTLQHCYGTKVMGLHVSTEHYRYLVEQIVALRQQWKRAQFPDPALTDWECPKCQAHSPASEAKCWTCSYDRTAAPAAPIGEGGAKP